MKALKRYKNRLRKPLTPPLAHCQLGTGSAASDRARCTFWRDVLCGAERTCEGELVQNQRLLDRSDIIAFRQPLSRDCGA